MTASWHAGLLSTHVPSWATSSVSVTPPTSYSSPVEQPSPTSSHYEAVLLTTRPRASALTSLQPA
eukprot:54098-Eustigmatos_ZCMA.PRE.1